MKAFDHVHRRYNPLLDEWVLVSPHRNKRPWQGYEEPAAQSEISEYDPNCYLCPGNKRAGGKSNPDYEGTFVFDNDFPAILPPDAEESASFDYDSGGLLRALTERGRCRVVCFHPDHSKSLAHLSKSELEAVVETWFLQTLELSALDYVKHIQIFENKGSIMGCSNPHPHGQIWAQSSIPSIAARKVSRMELYYSSRRRTILSAYLSEELALDKRIIYSNEYWVVLVPFWACWPFETMLIPKRAVPDLTQLDQCERDAMADAIGVITKKYDKVFSTSFPYSSGIHQKPFNGKLYPGYHMHMQFFPPLLRSATVKKFMVGYEMFAESQRDISAEQAAEILKSL